MNRHVLVAASLAVCVLCSACKRKGAAPPVATSSLADSAEQVLYNVRWLLTDRGVQRGELFADTLFVFEENNRFELRKVRVTFNTSTGAKDGVMSANRGRYNLRSQILEGFGDVVIVTNDGKRLTTPHVKYTQGLNEIASDTNFTLVRPGQTVEGVGFTADPQLTRLRVLRGFGAKGSFMLPGQ